MSSLIGSPPETGATTPTAVPARQGLSAGRARTARRGLRVLAAVVVLGVAWALIAPNYPSFVFPTPADVWASFTRAVERGVWVEQVLATLGHLGSAFAIVLVAGLPLGILIGRSIIAEDLSRVVLVFFQTVPTVVLIALALAIYGISDESVIGVTVAGSITYFLLNVIQGTRAIDRDLVDMARAYHANETTIMRTVVVPSVIPYFLAGARITLGVAWQITLFSEYLMGSAGIGFNVNTAISLLDTSTVFMWGLSVVALTLLVEYGLFRPVERRLTRHMRRT
ncbi:MAG: ABC transporter permease [Actinomycetota bacterium]|nr:ABC transporter permease [Actinomycetota bacterium]